MELVRQDEIDSLLQIFRREKLLPALGFDPATSAIICFKSQLVPS